MYKIIYRNPSNPQELKSDEVEENKAKLAAQAKKDGTIFVLSSGTLIDGRLIQAIEKIKESVTLPEPRDAYSYRKPTKQQHQALVLAVLYDKPSPLWASMPEHVLLGAVKSVWDWQNKRTDEMIELGSSLMAKGETAYSMFMAIKRSQP